MTVMSQSDGHSRRDFLKGKAAVRAVVDKAQEMVETTADALGIDRVPDSALHLQASRRAMACEFSVLYHEQDRSRTGDVVQAFDEIDALEDQLTIYRDWSEVIEINQTAAQTPTVIEPRLFGLLQLSQRIHDQTRGAFDITSGPLSRVWGFLRREGRLPEQEEINAVRMQVGFDKVRLDSEQQTISFVEQDVEINLNSIGKGYALDRTAEILDEAGLDDYIWHGGGSSVLARGKNQADVHNAWTVGIRNPLKPVQRIAEIYLRNQAIGTAGSGTQFFEHDGQRYSHIIDPRTGWPAQGKYTTTVVAPTAAEADALATAFFVMHIEEIEAYCVNHPEIAAVVISQQENAKGFEIHEFGMPEDSWCKIDVG